MATVESISTVGDLRYICLSQNIGAIDPSQAGVTNADVKSMIDRFSISMNAFLKALAQLMHDRSNVKNAGNNLKGTNSYQLHDDASGGESVASASGSSKRSATEGCSTDAFDVVVLHLQEIGGKKRSESVMTMLNEVVGSIYPSAGWCSGLLMSTMDCPETFTAMGTVIFISRRITGISSILSYKRNRTFVALDDDPLTYVSTTVDGKSETTKDLLFAGKKFSDAGTSRKGYMLTSLRVGTQIMNFVNVHMFHDEDNRIAVQASPSAYALRRTKTWGELIADILPLINPSDPCFIFGDLNTRLDGMHLFDFARSTFALPPINAKKAIERTEAFWDYVVQPTNVAQMLKFDREMSALMNIAGQQGLELGELPIRFPPTFTKEPAPAAIDDSGLTQFYSQVDNGIYRLDYRVVRPSKNERFPAFCDRVLFNPEGLRLVSGQYASSGVDVTRPNVWKLYEYSSAVLDCTDHDCVYLTF